MNHVMEFHVTAQDEDGLEESTSVAVEFNEQERRQMLASEPNFSVMNQDPALEQLTGRVQKAAYDSGWVPFPEEDDEDGLSALNFPDYIVDYPQEIVLDNWKARQAQKP